MGAELLIGIAPAAMTVKAEVRALVGRHHKLHRHIAIALLPSQGRVGILAKVHILVAGQVCRPPVHEELLDVTHVRTVTLRDALVGEEAAVRGHCLARAPRFALVPAPRQSDSVAIGFVPDQPHYGGVAAFVLMTERSLLM